ncbi:MAG: lamin tail domain-containing protein [Actinobacteria bacterium]|nr:lamin tail domain-containing protein [Actinomycetota bacterium]
MRRTPILAAAALLAACTSPDAVPGATAPTAPAPGVAVPAMPDGAVPVEVLDVRDGDTVEVEFLGEAVEVRLLGINTPERDECWADEARDALEALLDGGDVTLWDAGTDQYGRVLGYLGAAGEFVNARLVAAGHAIAISADHLYAPEFRAADDAAAAAGAGLWAPDACGPDRGTAVRILEVDGDPPGRDDDPGGGESATIRNDGAGEVDVSGWTLRDESSAHRFTFPAGTRLGPGEEAVVWSVCRDGVLCFPGGGAVWSNGGDTALLLDASGNVVDRAPFGR